ncbi:MAG: right-handed parallel beta-helix repeat-containing protein [Puniceicoccales bacterium]|jgi:hypothetical protein|nr:right-handed parallel beta-helix repeat-containing protein [Puniceicoccales bacterium]
MKTTRQIFSFIAILTATTATIPAQQNTGGGTVLFETLYAAPNGNSDAPGTPAEPLSLSAVRQRLRSKSAGKSNLAVVLLDGTYELDEPLVFTNDMDGDAANTVVWGAENPGAAILSGARTLKLKWTPVPGRPGLFQADTPPGLKPFDQLYVNGAPQILARYPNHNPAAKYLNGTARDATDAARAARWKKPAGGFVHALHRGHWGDFHYAITGKTPENKLILEGGWGNNRPEQGPHRDHRFVEGIFEELDAPGEWFHDAATRTLYYQPPADIDLATATTSVPQLETLVHITGTRDNPVRNLRLIGFTYKHTLRTFMKKREPLQRSDWCVHRGGAILIENAENCVIANSTLTLLGGNAICVNNYNRNITLSGNHIHDIGANGILFVGDATAARSPLYHYSKTQSLETMDKTPGPKNDNYPSNCRVADTLITRIGVVEKQSAGVNIDLSSRITLSHCTIANVPRAGINIGSGTWGGHRIEHCDIFDTVRETGDHGSFNSWGRDRFWYPDRRITNRNVAAHPDMPYWDVTEEITIDHNRWRCDHGWDIDLDDGSSRYRITNNLCLNGGIKLREGYGRIVENNITVNNGFHPHCWYAQSNDIVRRNIFFKNYAPSHMGKEWGRELDFNIIHRHGVTDPVPATELQERSRKDQHSIAADARFLSPEKGDYRVAPDSPAAKLGFVNFPMDNFGVTSPRLRALAPAVKLPDHTTAVSDATAGNRRSDATRTWQKARIKNIVGLGERSAAGLMEETGVWLVGDTAKSKFLARYGARDGDVLLRWNNVTITSVEELLAAEKTTPAPSSIHVWRNQQMVQLNIK